MAGWVPGQSATEKLPEATNMEFPLEPGDQSFSLAALLQGACSCGNIKKQEEGG